MRIRFALVTLAVLLVTAGIWAHADNVSPPVPNPSPAPAATTQTDTVVVTQHTLGKATAPLTVHEYVSLTCPHCAEFYNNVMPELEKKYVETGKVRFMLHPFARDAIDLKAFSLASCMPDEQYYAFIAVLFKNQQSWVMTNDPGKVLTQYSMLGGLPEDKAKTCMTDTKLQDAIAAGVKEAEEKFNIQSTPTFIIDPGVERIDGLKSVPEFSALLDKMLAKQNTDLNQPKAEPNQPKIEK